MVITTRNTDLQKTASYLASCGYFNDMTPVEAGDGIVKFMYTGDHAYAALYIDMKNDTYMVRCKGNFIRSSQKIRTPDEVVRYFTVNGIYANNRHLLN